MRRTLQFAALVVLVSVPAHATHGYGLRELFGCGRDSCGCAECGCGCEANCGCEPGCCCEPTCGCGGCCGVDGRQFAGQKWDCCDECGPPICACTGPTCCCEPSCGCGPACGCGACCEPACECGPACGCETCCEPAYGCGGCDCHDPGCVQSTCCFGSWIGQALNVLCKPCGCSGCSSELYWCEWHNDPPRCCDPCDWYGNWVGPSYGGYRAPYAHPYGPAATGEVYARGSALSRTNPVARSKPRPRPRSQVARQSTVVPAAAFQR